MRHAHLLGAKEPLMYRLVPALVAEMGAAYPGTGPRAAADRGDAAAGGNALPPDAGQRPASCSTRRPADLATGRHACRRDRVQALRHLRLPLRPDRGRAARARACRSTAPASTPRWPSRRPRRAPPGRARAPRPPTTSGSTSPRSMARPSSPAIRATKARAWCSRSSRTAQRVEQRRGRRDGRHPAQPDALLRRERRPDRRHRKTDYAQGLRRRS